MRGRFFIFGRGMFLMWRGLEAYAKQTCNSIANYRILKMEVKNGFC
jgi:hypothetical protein